MGTPAPQHSDSPPSSDEIPRCARCGDVVGVYEPLVHIREGCARRSSRAAEPGIWAAGGDIYHVDCYERVTGRTVGAKAG